MQSGKKKLEMILRMLFRAPRKVQQSRQFYLLAATSLSPMEHASTTLQFITLPLLNC